MVFESLVTDLLNRFLGDYVENLDRSQLKLGIWGGDAVLANLDVRQGALDELDLPVKIKHGHLDKLTLRIPWKNLYTEPVVVDIDGLYVVAVPNVGVAYDEKKAQKEEQDAKQKELVRIETTKAAQDALGGEVKQDTFAEKMVTQVIKNLQVRIGKIHIRYEDKFTTPKNPFSIGFTLESLSFETTDAVWMPCVIKEAVTTIFKMVKLNNLAVYWNSNTDLISDEPKDKLKAELIKRIAIGTDHPSVVNYLLKPIRSEVKLTLNTKPGESEFTVPKVQLSVIFEEIAVHLGKLQYHDIMNMLESFERMSMIGIYRKYGRPEVELTKHSKEWWRYGYRCILEGSVRRRRLMWSWKHIKQHRDTTRRYQALWQKKTLNKKLSSDEVASIAETEKELDVFNITMSRQLAEIEAKKAQKQAEKKDNQSGGWFGGWFGGGAKKEIDTNDIQKEFSKVMTLAEKNKLYEAIGYQENAVGDVSLPKEYVATKLLFRLSTLSISLNDPALACPQVLQFTLQDVFANMDQRPSADAIKLNLKIDSLTVGGSPVNGSVPTMVTSISSEADRIFSLLDVYVETNPLDGECDSRIHLSTRPMRIIYDAVTINQVVELFKPPESVRLKQLQAAAMSKFEELKDMSATGMQHVIDEHKYMQVNVDLKPAHIIIPEKGVYSQNGSLILLSLGNLKVSSDKNEIKKFDGSESIDDIMKRAYDQFSIKLQSIQALFVQPGDDWQTALTVTNSSLHILRPMDLNLTVHKSIIVNPRMPKVKVQGELPLLSVNVSDHRLKELLALVQSIPAPPADSSDTKTDFDDDNDLLPTKTSHAAMTVLSQVPVKTPPASVDDKFFDTKSALSLNLDDVDSSAQVTDLELIFEVFEISLNISQRKDGVDVPTIKIVLESLGARLALRSFDMHLTAYLTAFYVQHLQFRELNDGPLVNLISTPLIDNSSFRLIIVEVIQASKKSPDFVTQYQSTEQTVRVNFSGLDVLLHQEAVLNVLEFAQSLSPPGDDQSNEAKTEDAKQKEKQIARAGRKKKDQPTVLINLKVEARMDNLRVGICNINTHITDVKIEGLEAGVTMQADRMDVSVTLKDIVVVDPVKNTLYSKILSTTNGSVFDMGVTIYDGATEGDNYANMHCVDTDVKVVLGCIKVVFLNRFVTDLLAFLNQFQAAKDKIAQASDKVKESAREQAVALHEKAARVRLNVEMKAPVIVIPQSSLSCTVLVMDFGKLTLSNQFFVTGADASGHPAILDKLRVELTNLQVNRSVLDEYGSAKAVSALLQPVTVNLSIIRNLSISFYKEKPEIDISGRLAAVTLEMSHGDFASIMSVLNENLSEGQTNQKLETTPRPPGASDTGFVQPAQSRLVTNVAEQAARAEDATVIYTKMALGFTLENLAVVVYTGKDVLAQSFGPVSRSADASLAKFQLDDIVVKLDMKSDNEMNATVHLHTCLLDDLRPGPQDKITRMIERKRSKTLLVDDEAQGQMIQINFTQNQTLDKNVIIGVNSLYICVCVEFLLSVSKIFTLPNTGDTTVTTKDKQLAASRKEPDPRPESDLTVKLTVLDPEIVLVDNPKSTACTALILDTQVSFLLRQTPDTTKMMGNISQLQIYAAAFEKEKRKATGSKNILNPCDICLNTSAPYNAGQQVALELTDVIINISPQIIRLLTQILSALSVPQSDDDNDSCCGKSPPDLWDKKNINAFNFWFFKHVTASDLSLALVKPDETIVTKKEEMIVAVSAIVIKLEAGVANRTVPMLIVEAGFDGIIKDWSTAMQVNFELKCEVAYFNESSAVWEPLLEPVEDSHDHRPWQLSIEFQKLAADAAAAADFVDAGDEADAIAVQPPKLTMEIRSYDILQLTMTKTCLEVLTNLGKAFNDAYNLKELTQGKTYEVPYVLCNMSGLSLTVQLDERFEMPEKSQSGIVVVTGGETLELRNFAAKKVLRRNETTIEMSQRGEERSISFTVEAFKATRSLVIQKAEKRSFNINQQSYPGDIWALICDTQTQLGCRVVTMRSIVQVHNSLPVRIHVFYKNEDGVLDRFGTMEADDVLNVPLNVVYTAPNHIFFKPDDDNYKVSSSGLSWRGLKHGVPELITCTCMQSGYRPFYFNATPTVEDVYFESTDEKTAKTYSIELCPTVILKNLLPVPIDYILESTSAQLTLAPGERKILFNACAGKTVVEIRLLNYMGKDWDTRVTLDTEGEELGVCTFEAADGYSTVTMELGVHTKSVTGFMEISLYSPYWMINKTKMPLQYKSSDDILFDHPATYTDAVLFAFKPSTFSKKRVMLKVCDSDWSDRFTVDTVGNSGTLTCKIKNYTYEVGVTISLSGSGLTKIVVFTPYYMLVNKAEFAVSCCELIQGATWTDVPPNECVPLWPIGYGRKVQMKAKVKDSGDETKPFPLNEMHTSLLKLRNIECPGLNVECQIFESSTIVIIDQYRDGMAPARLINDTQMAIVFTQSGITDEETLGPRETMLYTWQDPLAKRELIWQCANEKGKNDLLRDDRGHFSVGDNKLFWVSILDGLQRVLLFTQDVVVVAKTQETDIEQVDQDIKVSLQGLGLSLINNTTRTEVAYLGITSSGVIWESKRKRYKALRTSQSQLIEEAWQKYQNELVVNVNTKSRVVIGDGKTEVDFADMIMYKPTKQLIRRSFEHGISIQYRVSPHQIQFHGKIHRLQLDSMLPGAVFQTILSPVPPPKSVAAESVPKPFTEISIMVRKNEHTNVLQFRYYHLLTQEMAVKIDQGFLNALLGLFTSTVSEPDPVEQFRADQKKICTSLMDDEVKVVIAGGQKNFYDDLHFTPLKIHLSFSLHGDDGDDTKNKPTALGINVVNLFLQSVGIVLTDVQDVVFKLGYFERKYTFYTQDQLLSEIIRHYSGQAIRQMYVLVLGLDVLGNPFGVIRGMAQGLEDLFYEPYQGAIQGPEEFAEGLALGVRSLFGHAIGGAAGAVSRITGTLGKGLATLTMDEDYLRKRREQMNRRPENVREGLARGGRGLVMGVFDGVTGIVSKPIEGARKEGVEGFFKGFGKGLVGVIARPASGVVDFASSGFEAMRRAAEMSDEIHRLRPPRYLPADGIVRPYKFREAEGNNILLETERGKFAHDKYEGHMAVSRDYKHILLITNKRLMMVSKGEIFGHWDCSWFYMWNELREPPALKAKGIQIVLKEKQKKLFGSSTVGKIVQFIDQEAAEWLVQRMQETMARYKEGL